MEEQNDSSLADFIESYNEKIEQKDIVEQAVPVPEPVSPEPVSTEEMVVVMLRALSDGNPKPIGALANETGYGPEATQEVVFSMQHAELVELWGDSFEDRVVKLVPDWQEKLSA